MVFTSSSNYFASLRVSFGHKSLFFYFNLTPCNSENVQHKFTVTITAATVWLKNGTVMQLSQYTLLHVYCSSSSNIGQSSTMSLVSNHFRNGDFRTVTRVKTYVYILHTELWKWSTRSSSFLIKFVILETGIKYKSQSFSEFICTITFVIQMVHWIINVVVGCQCKTLTQVNFTNYSWVNLLRK